MFSVRTQVLLITISFKIKKNEEYYIKNIYPNRRFHFCIL